MGNSPFEPCHRNASVINCCEFVATPRDNFDRGEPLVFLEKSASRSLQSALQEAWTQRLNADEQLQRGRSESSSLAGNREPVDNAFARASPSPGQPTTYTNACDIPCRLEVKKDLKWEGGTLGSLVSPFDGCRLSRCGVSLGPSAPFVMSLVRAKVLFAEEEEHSCDAELVSVHCVEQMVCMDCHGGFIGEGNGAMALVRDVQVASEDLELNVSESSATTVEFLVRVAPDMVGKVWLSVFYNGDIPLAEHLEVASSFQFFNFHVPKGQEVWSVSLQWTSGNSSQAAEFQAPELDQQAVLQLDVQHGLRIRGLDLLHCARLESPVAGGGDWRLRGKTSTLQHMHARGGLLGRSLLPGRVSVDQSLEFVARGLTGCEQLDVFFNGLSVACDSGLRLDGDLMQARLLRYAVAPASSEIFSVVIYVSFGADRLEDREREPAVMIDPSFGVMVGGQDCLVTATFVDRITGERNPHGWSWDSPEQASLRQGHWNLEGFYYLLPYRRKTRARQRELPQDVVTT